MTQMVKSFREVTPEWQVQAGGKGRMLAVLFQKGYPVPEGFVILPAAFNGERLLTDAWEEVEVHLKGLRKKQKGTLFAVRSSALNEDSATASFAGEFTTVLNAGTDTEVRQAVYEVFQSKDTERVKAYGAAHGIAQAHGMAVVVQRMLCPEISGVLFTADPVTGSYANMTGNYVYGLGEQLVSGETNAHVFTISRPKGKYTGPAAFRKYASGLYRFSSRLEKEEGCPQDIEWAVAGGKLYLLQARPVTTLTAGNPDTYEFNYSLVEDALWTNTNVAEAIPDVLSPLNWSIGRKIDEEMNFIPGYYVWSGNICGRAYTNISQRLSMIKAVTGINIKQLPKLLGDLFGQMPAGMSLPFHPFSRADIFREIFPRIMRVFKSTSTASKNLLSFIKEAPGWCSRMTERIRQAATKEALVSLWKEVLLPHTRQAFWASVAGGIKLFTVMTLDKKLTKLVGTEDANLLLSHLRGEKGLASLGPVTGISKVIRGQMTREEYIRQYGHRGPHEYELSIPHPAEDPQWLEKQIEEYKKSDIDVDELFGRQFVQYESARERFGECYPHKVKWLEKQLAKAAAGAAVRETTRSEFVRVFRLIRLFVLKAGALTGIGEDAFLLYIDEILDVLSGDSTAVKRIPARRRTFEKYKTLPPFPAIIRGRFNPFKWAEDPAGRRDYYDATLTATGTAVNSETLKGYPGAAGKVEGIVRILSAPEEGEKLQVGEILVAVTTNIGWTPFFPKAAAIITDVGAPLSHAAIVARELGIPAVVGCGNATTRLKTGDRVVVNGGQGVVQITTAVDNTGG